MSPASHADDFLPTASLKNLRLRAQLLRRLREFFDERGFLEVETPVLSADTVVDRHLDPFSVVVQPASASRAEKRYWLQTSPEFGMKRLLVAGATAIYQVTRAFRQDEQGPLHNPEFTMVEWYRVGDRLAEGMQLLSDLGETLLGRGPAERLTYREAFCRYAGFDPHTITNESLVATVKAAGIDAPASMSPDDRDGWLDLVLVDRVQPRLGEERPAILHDFPASQAALARVRPDDPPVAERFELYVAGMELANGYHELLDPAVLRDRNAQSNQLRRADGKPSLPEDSRLLSAMDAGLPPSTGVAMGFDRIVMLAAGAQRLDEVIAFPFDRA
ncbi:MAG: EF-P lysine aminoacylase EpmA [Thermoguttaceae bacterium]